jgi:hypothetical protein
MNGLELSALVDVEELAVLTVVLVLVEFVYVMFVYEVQVEDNEYFVA